MLRNKELTEGRRPLIAATVGMTVGYANVLWCFGLFVIPLSTAYGWTRSEIALGIALMNLTMVPMHVITGSLLDRVGVRPVLLPAIALFAIGNAALAFVGGRLWQFYLTLVLLAVVGSAMMPTSYNRALAGWFDRSRGLSFGIAMAGSGLGGMLLPAIVAQLISRGGMPAGYFGMAFAVAAITLPVTALFMSERTDRPGSVESTNQQPVYGLLRDSRLLRLLVAFICLGVFEIGSIVHLAPMLIDRGSAPTAAAFAVSVLAAALTTSRLTSGYLLDRWPTRIVVIVCMLASAAGLTGLAAGASGIAAASYVFLIGLGIGASINLLSYLVSRHFPLEFFSRLLGLTMSVRSVGGAAGPVLLSATYGIFGGYSQGLWVLVGLIAFATILLASLPAPPRHATNPIRAD